MRIIEDYFNNVAVYIDNSNLLNILKEISGNLEHNGERIDYALMIENILTRLKNHLNYQKDLHLRIVRIYDGLTKDNEEKRKKKERFINTVEWRIRDVFKTVYVTSRFIEFNIRKRKLKGDDTLMAADILYDAITRSADFIVIISGDGDFVSVIKALRNKTRIPTIVAFFDHNINRNLKQVADLFLKLDLNEIKIKK